MLQKEWLWLKRIQDIFKWNEIGDGTKKRRLGTVRMVDQMRIVQCIDIYFGTEREVKSRNLL